MYRVIMEVMANHNMSHESLNSPHDVAMATIQPDSTLQIPQSNGPIITANTRDGMSREQREDGSELGRGGEESGTSIGCQTALSYAKQDTLVPLTALLQLVNNSILTVMENIGEFF